MQPGTTVVPEGNKKIQILRLRGRPCARLVAKGEKWSPIFKALAEETRTEPKYVAPSGCFQPNEEWKDEANLVQRLYISYKRTGNCGRNAAGDELLKFKET